MFSLIFPLRTGITNSIQSLFIFQDDIESIVAQIEAEERKRLEVVEHIVGPPSRRVNFSLVAHPEKEELILFGGEYFNGKTVRNLTILNPSLPFLHLPAPLLFNG